MRATSVRVPTRLVTTVVRMAATIAGHTIRPPSTGRTSWKIARVASPPAAKETATMNGVSGVMAQMYGALPPKRQRPARSRYR